jgi:IPT/TIG domain
VTVTVTYDVDDVDSLAATFTSTGATPPIFWGWGDGTTELGPDLVQTNHFPEGGLYTTQVRSKEGTVPVVVGVGGTVVGKPWLGSLDPSSALLSDADLTVHLRGGNFTAQSVIVWGGAEVPTTYVSAAELTTDVQPSAAGGPGSEWVQVQGDGGAMSNPLVWQFPNFPLPLPAALQLSVTVTPVGGLAADVVVSNNSEASVVDFGDGSPTEALTPWEPVGGWTGSPRHTFPSVGPYTVTVTMGATVAEDTVTLTAVGFDPSDHTVTEVQDYVTANPDQRAAVLAAEQAGKNRVTLVNWLSGEA